MTLETAGPLFCPNGQSPQGNNPHITVEVLIPDFQGSREALKTVVDSDPEIINHNLETVPRLYPEVRPQAVYQRSMDLLKRVKEINPEDHQIRAYARAGGREKGSPRRDGRSAESLL